MNTQLNSKWLKDNWFKVGIIVGILILAFSVLSLKSDSPLNKTESLKLSVQCREDGEKLFQEDKEEVARRMYGPNIINCYYFEPNFLYNEKLNTCLYSGGYTCDLNKKKTEGFGAGDYAKRWTRHIKDVYANKEVAEVTVLDTSNVSDFESTFIDNFWDTYAELGFVEDYEIN